MDFPRAWREIAEYRKPVIQGVLCVIGGNSYRGFGLPGGGLCVFRSLLRYKLIAVVV